MKKYVKLYEEFLISLNEDNKETILYHGTPYKFDTFDIEKSSPYQLYGQGIYLTDNINVAKNYIGGILKRKSKDARIIKCTVNTSKFKNIDDIITDDEISELQNLVIEYNDDFWFKRINLDNKPKKWSNDFYINPKLINRKDLEKFSKLAKEDGYYKHNRLSFYDVYGILTDDFNTIHSKRIIREYLMKKGIDGLIIPTVGDGIGDDNLIQNIYCVFNTKCINIIEDIKESVDKVILPYTILHNGKHKQTRNSLGEYISSNIQEIHNFYDWFGDSKAVDDKARPYVFLHASHNSFEIFNKGSFGKMGSGIYFTTDKDYINRLIKLNGYKNIYECYLKCENPLYLENPLSKRELSNQDSIITRLGDESDETVVFKPNQIKHINNNGEYNKNNDNIYL